MMKKIFAGFMAVLMSVFATGCRNHSEDSDNNANNDTTVTTDSDGNVKNADQKENGKSGNGASDGEKTKETEAVTEAVTEPEISYVYDEAGNIDIDAMPDPEVVTETPAEEEKPSEEQGEQTLEYTEDGDIII